MRDQPRGLTKDVFYSTTYLFEIRLTYVHYGRRIRTGARPLRSHCAASESLTFANETESESEVGTEVSILRIV